MGLSPFHLSKSVADIKSSSPPRLPNPVPTNFRVMRTHELGKSFAIEVRYPDCTNYEGRKIMVYHNTKLKKLLAQGSLDPHFCGSKNYISPIARFRPTDLGWELACDLVVTLHKRKNPNYDLPF